MKNLAEQDDINEAIQKGLKPLLVCANCGIAHNFMAKGTSKGSNFLECIPFTGWEARLPLGIQPDGTIVDYRGKKYQPDDFLTTYGVDAEIYLKWRNSAKPKPAHTC